MHLMATAPETLRTLSAMTDDASAESPAESSAPSTPVESRLPSRSVGISRQNTVSAALEAYAREQQEALTGHGPAVRMSTAGGEHSYLTSIVGMTGQQILIIAAPKSDEGEPADIQLGQRWVFRTIHHTTAVRFEGIVKSVVAGDTPHVYVELTSDIERRVVRKAARVAVSMRATLLLPTAVQALVIDLSIGGARVAIDADMTLDSGHSVMCSTTITIVDRLYALELKGLVLSREPPLANHPDIAIYRMRFDSFSDISFLALQAYLATQLVKELDSFWRLVAGPLR
jgi:hypothetical protein